MLKDVSALGDVTTSASQSVQASALHPPSNTLCHKSLVTSAVYSQATLVPHTLTKTYVPSTAYAVLFARVETVASSSLVHVGH